MCLLQNVKRPALIEHVISRLTLPSDSHCERAGHALDCLRIAAYSTPSKTATSASASSRRGTILPSAPPVHAIPCRTMVRLLSAIWPSTRASLELAVADGGTVTLDSLRAVVDSPRVVVATITGKLASGTYAAKWHAVAADGAKGSGDFSFMSMSMMKPE